MLDKNYSWSVILYQYIAFNPFYNNLCTILYSCTFVSFTSVTSVESLRIEGPGRAIQNHFPPLMVTHDVDHQEPDEEQLVLRKVVGNRIPPSVTPAAELMLCCHPNLHFQWLPEQPLTLIAITFNGTKLREGAYS